MMDYSRYKLSFDEARSIIESYDNLTDNEFVDQIRHWSKFDVPEYNYGSIYKDIRKNVVEEFRKSLSISSNKINYSLDLNVGLKLYEFLNPDSGFNIIMANDDDIWRYISVKVMPDLTFIRYPNNLEDEEVIKEYIPNLSYSNGIKPEKGSIRLKKKRFYSHTRRIWLKTLWWYIHLGWQGDYDKTYNVLKDNGSNIISHFIERPGRGYRESLFRLMLYAYSQLPERNDSIFRAAAKLNLAKCISVEPALTNGGEKVYSQSLFKEVYAKENANRNAKKSDIE